MCGYFLNKQGCQWIKLGDFSASPCQSISGQKIGVCVCLVTVVSWWVSQKNTDTNCFICISFSIFSVCISLPYFSPRILMVVFPLRQAGFVPAKDTMIARDHHHHKTHTFYCLIKLDCHVQTAKEQGQLKLYLICPKISVNSFYSGAVLGDRERIGSSPWIWRSSDRTWSPWHEPRQRLNVLVVTWR